MRRHALIPALVAAAMAALPGSAAAADKTATCATLQATLNGAENGDVITLDSSATPGGLCTGQYDLKSFTSFVSYTFKGDSADGHADGFDRNEAAGRALTGSDVQRVSIRDLTFRDGRQTGNGGAIAITGDSGPFLGSDLRFFNNRATGNGGAVYIARTAPDTRFGMSIGGTYGSESDATQGNRATVGGAVAVQTLSGETNVGVGGTYANNVATQTGGGVDYQVGAGLGENVTLLDLTAIANQAGGGGGGARVVGGHLSLYNSTFERNTVEPMAGSPGGAHEGGGLLVNSPEFSSQSLNNQFRSNAIKPFSGAHDYRGGGASITARGLIESNGVGSAFTGNTLPDRSNGSTVSQGGGLYFNGTGTSIPPWSSRLSVIAGNSVGAGGQGGGAYLNRASLYLASSTVAGNSVGAGGSRAGLSAAGGGGLTLKNSIVSNSPSPDIGGFTGTPNVEYTNACASAGAAFLGSGNLCANPQLANAAGGDVHQTPSSPTIDKGSNLLFLTETESPPSTDFEGDPRPTDGDGIGEAVVDMGADESPDAQAVSTFVLSAATYSVGEGGGNVTVTISRASGVSNEASVRYATSNGTATAGQDYTARSGTLTFAAGEAEKTVTIPILDDGTVEGDETFGFALSNPGAGAALGTPSSATITIVDNDSANTSTQITGGPSGPTNDPRPSFSFSSTPATGVTYRCWIDNATPVACTSPYRPPAALSNGQHTFHLEVTDAQGNKSTVSRPFFVDTVPPSAVDVTIRPSAGGDLGGGRYSGFVQLSPTAGDASPSSGVATIRCALDPPSVPRSYDDLPAGPCPSGTGAVGTHTFYVAAIDSAGNKGPVRAVTFTIVAVPDTTITGGPSGATWVESPQFGFSSSIPGSTFRCRVDNRDYVPCSEPYTSPALSAGDHTFSVFAVAPGGVADPSPATRSFRVNGPRTDSADCRVSPFQAIDNGTGRGTGDLKTTCEIYFGERPSCQVWKNCEFVPDKACPFGAICTLTTKATWNQVERSYLSLTYANSRLEQTRPQLAVSGQFSRTCRTVKDCSVTDVQQGLGRAPMVSTCSSLVTVPTGPGYVEIPPRAKGAAASLTLSCRATVDVRPAPAYKLYAYGENILAFFPAAGTVTVTPSGSQSAAAGVAKKKPRKKAKKRRKAAPFKQFKRTAKEPGAVKLTPKLSKAAKRTLKRKKKLSLSIRLTFTPKAGGTPVTRTQRVTLRPKAKRPRKCVRRGRGQKRPKTCVPRSLR